jgi:hypothetical protein
MNMEKKIAILGWGSLLWEVREDFDRWHGQWLSDGPALKLEFSRISTTRRGALTLVIDQSHGALTEVSYCLSNRREPEVAIGDLQRREGMPTSNNVGFLDCSQKNTKYGYDEIYDHIRTWAVYRNIGMVIWTALPSNFSEKVGRSFSVPNAVSYLKNLPGKEKAIEYINRAPTFIQTPLRTALEGEPWFTSA